MIFMIVYCFHHYCVQSLELYAAIVFIKLVTVDSCWNSYLLPAEISVFSRLFRWRNELSL